MIAITAERAICSPKVGPIAIESNSSTPNSRSSAGCTLAASTGESLPSIWYAFSPSVGFSTSWIFAVSTPSNPSACSAERRSSTDTGSERATSIRVPDSKSMPRLSCLVANAIAPIARITPEIEKNHFEAPVKSNFHCRPSPLAPRKAGERTNLARPSTASTAWVKSTAVASSSKNTKFSLASASGTALSSTRRQTMGAKRLLSEAAKATSFSATSEATESGLSTNTMVSARTISASMRFHHSSKA